MPWPVLPVSIEFTSGDHARKHHVLAVVRAGHPVCSPPLNLVSLPFCRDFLTVFGDFGANPDSSRHPREDAEQLCQSHVQRSAQPCGD